jgi:hypothetical protein
MASWTIRGDGGVLVVIEVIGDQITIDVPSGVPFSAKVRTAEEFRVKLGAAIGAARQPGRKP